MEHKGCTSVLLSADRATHNRGVWFVREAAGNALGVEAIITYDELLRRARNYSGALTRAGIRRGQRLALCVPAAEQALPLFLGALDAGIAVVPVEAPLTVRALESFPQQLLEVLRVSGASALVVTSKIDSIVGDRWAPPTGCVRLTLDALQPSNEPQGSPIIAGDEIALVQVSRQGSSTTATPITHGALLDNLGLLAREYEVTDQDVFVSWLPPLQEAGLTALLLPLYCGATLSLLPTTTFLKRPGSWLETIHRSRATISFAPEDGYALCLAKIKDSELGALDLSCWRLAGSTHNKVTPETATALDAKLARAGFRGTARLCAHKPLPDLSADGGFDLSHGQRALWFIAQLAPQSVAYNVSMCLRIRSPYDRGALHSALQVIYHRHAALRSVFRARAGVPRRELLPSDSFEFRSIDAQGVDDAALQQRAVTEVERSFDLAEGPLFGVKLLERGPADAVLLLVAHHIVVDMLSFVVIVAELGELYDAFTRKSAPELAAEIPVDASFDAFVRWQRACLAGPRGEQLRQFWSGALAGAPSVLSLPTDRPRPRLQTYRGAAIPLRFDDALAAELRALAKAHETTLFAVLLAVLQVLLHRRAGQDDVLVASPVSGRSHSQFALSVGYFVNTLPLRARFSATTTFGSLLAQLRGTVTSALDHQDLPFPSIVEQAKIERDLSRSPLCQVMFALQNPPGNEQTSGIMRAAVGGGEAQLGGLCVEVIDLPRRIAQFDLRLNLLDAGDGLSGFLEYNADLFDASTAEQLVADFSGLARALTHAPERPVREHRLVAHGLDAVQAPQDGATQAPAPAQDLAQIARWNDTRVSYPSGCVPRAIEQQAQRTPLDCALELESERMTYAALNGGANRIARVLRSLGVGKDVLVGVAMERSLELPLALLAALKAGAAYVPLDPSLPAERLQCMLADARPRVVIASHATDATLASSGAHVLDVTDLQAIARDPALDDGDLDLTVEPEDLAYVIYTSGSTGTPKAVANTHAGLWNRLCWMQQTFALEQRDCVLQKTPYSFDVSVWELFWPLMYGARLAIARPGGHKDSRYLLEEIERSRVTTLHFVPSMLEAFLFEPELEAERLRSVKRVICSGEALPYALVSRFFERLPAVELFNLYGPTEASIDVTAHRCEPNARAAVPIGRPVANTQIHILDEQLRAVPIGSVGELFIGGVQVARGYLNRPQLTAERFIDDPFSDIPGARLYRTGDLARWHRSGVIEYVGRNDAQIKLRGQRVELGEIEAVAEQHPAVARCVVLTRKNAASGLRLHAVLLTAPVPGNGNGTGSPLDLAQVEALLRRKLPQYMVPVAFTQLSSLPTTHSGKVDRAALLAQLEATLPARDADAAPRTQREHVLLEVWRQVLGVPEISIHDNYFALGGDSIRSLQLRALARARGLDFEVPALFAHQTIAELADALQDCAAPQPEPVLVPFARVDEATRAQLSDYEDAFPATQLQLGMLYHSELSVQSWAYHDIFGFTLELRDEFRADALRDALAWVMRCHPVLRSSFDLGSYTQPLQLIAHQVEAPLAIRDLRALHAEDAAAAEAVIARHIESEKASGFRTQVAPLFRFTAHLLSTRRVQLTLSFHHAILDGWSTASLVRELLTEYARRSGGTGLPVLPSPAHSFAGYGQLEAEAIASEESRAYFLGQLQDSELTRVARRADAPAQDRAGAARIVRDIDRPLTDRLLELAKQRSVPLKALLLSAHARVISAYSGQHDVVTGRVVHGRPEVADAERILGLFLNTLPTRLRLADKTWASLVREVVQQEHNEYAHRRFPMHEIQRLLDRKALFETAFNFVNYHLYDALLDDGALKLTGFEAHENTAFVLLANFVELAHERRISLHLEYDAGQIAPELAQQISGAYVRALEALAHDFDARVVDACVLDAEERSRLLEVWNNASAGAPAEPVHALVERTARRAPDAVAVRCESHALTYAELDQQAEALARRLLACGAAPSDVVAICAEPSVERAIAVLAVLKAGCAYLPLDPEYPGSRLEHMLDHARASVALVTRTYARERFLAGRTRLELEAGALANAAATAAAATASRDPLPVVDAHELAYVIFTSGSTGRPKAIAMPHAPLANLIAWQVGQSALRAAASTAQLSAFSFDVSFQEMFATWAAGGTLVMVPQSCRKDARALARLLQSERINRLFVPVVVLHQLAEVAQQLQLEFADLREINSAGEQLELNAAVRELFRRHPQCVLANHYGPSETHVATAHVLPADRERWPFAPPIGRPLPGVRCYVLDATKQLLPPGVPGELYLGGACVARGYYDDDRLSAERFVPDPFVPDGGRMYRTGDLARHRSDGTLEYLGRRDGQVKIRGYRVEVAEVEAALAALDPQRIRQATVIARPSRSQATRHELAAYVVLDRRASDGAALDTSALRERLARELPAYMLPSSICELTELPLTPSGKVDRLALSTWAVSRADAKPHARVPPATPLETELLALWGELLVGSELGVTDNFFDHGGDSLVAVRLVARVQRRYGLELPISALVKAPTVRELAELIDRARAGATLESPALVRLHASDATVRRAPLFCVHPIGGNVLCYMPLAKRLGRRQPLYGLQARGLHAGEAPCCSIPDMARAYARELVQAQPAGRIHIAGWSFGGILAVELARQLSAAGRELAPVIVLDTMASARFVVAPTELDVLEGFAVELFGGELEESAWQELLSTKLSHDARVERLVARARADGLVPAGVGPEQLERVFAVMRASLKAFDTYEQRPFAGEIVLLRCLDAMPRRLRRMHELLGSSFEEPTNGWGQFCRAVRVVPVHGNHLTIMREPHIAHVAQIVGRVLEGRGADIAGSTLPQAIGQ